MKKRVTLVIYRIVAFSRNDPYIDALNRCFPRLCHDRCHFSVLPGFSGFDRFKPVRALVLAGFSGLRQCQNSQNSGIPGPESRVSVKTVEFSVFSCFPQFSTVEHRFCQFSTVLTKTCVHYEESKPLCREPPEQ